MPERNKSSLQNTVSKNSSLNIPSQQTSSSSSSSSLSSAAPSSSSTLPSLSSLSSSLPPSVSAGVSSPNNSGNNNGKRSVKSPGMGASTPETIIKERSNHYESVAAGLFAKNIIQLLPEANLTVVNEKLLDEERIRGRILHRAVLGEEIFRDGLTKFITGTIQPLKLWNKQHPSRASGMFSFDKFAKYDSEDCMEIEMDCCVKVPVSADVEISTLDARVDSPMIPIINDGSVPSILSSSSISSSTIASPISSFPSSFPSSSSSSSSSISTERMTYASIVNRTASAIPSVSSPLSINGTKTPSRSPNRKNCDADYSNKFYPPGAISYLFAEIYASLSTITLEEFLLKLLQAERILCIILAKEKKENIRECVLAFFFMGPSLSDKDARAIFRTLCFYQPCFPNLWALQGNKNTPTRLFVQNVSYTATTLNDVSLQISMDTFKRLIDGRMEKQEYEIKELRSQVASLSSRLDMIIKMLVNKNRNRMQAKYVRTHTHTPGKKYDDEKKNKSK